VTEPVADQDQTASDKSGNSSNMIVLLPGDADRAQPSAGAQGARSGRRRRLAVLATVIAVASVCGAAGGSIATIALGHLFASHEPKRDIKTATADDMAVLKDAVARINADVNGVKADIDRVGKTRTAQLGKLGERLDKVEKTQDDASAKIARVSDAQTKDQDKLRVASASADTTGSITAATAARTDPGKIASRTDPQSDSRKTPIVEGWTLTRVSGGGAILDGPGGIYEAYPGDPLPGLGRVDAVRYQDGRWVVVTQKGLIVHR
jgi:hypothetical protein